MQRKPADRPASIHETAGRGDAAARPLNGSAAAPRSTDNEDLLGPLTESARALTRLARIEWERAKAAVKGARRRALLSLWEVVFIGTLTITGAIVLVQGITKGFGRLFGAEWAGDLAAAVAILGGAVGFAAFRTQRRDRLHRTALSCLLEEKDPK